MVKQVSSKTLDDVVRELKAQNKTLQQQLEVEKVTLQEQVQARMDALGGQTTRLRETIGNMFSGAKAAVENEAVRNRVGAGVGRATGKLIGPATMAAFNAASVPIVAMMSAVGSFGLQMMKHTEKLARLAKVVRIGAFALGLPALISFIADGIWSRPEFRETIDTVKNVLNEEVWPALQSLVGAVADIGKFFLGVGQKILDSFGGGTLGAILGFVGDMFTRIQDSVQDVVLDIIQEVVKLVPTVINTITALLKLDFITAWDTLINGIIDGLSALLDSLLTNLIQIAFPEAFGESGSLFNSIRGFFSDMATGISNGFSTFKDGVMMLWDVYIVGGAANLLAAMINMRDKIRDGFTSFGEEVAIQWNNMIAFFTDPTREGSIPYTFNAGKEAIKNGWNSFMEVLTVNLPNSLTELKDGILETAGNIVKSLYVTPIENAIKFVMGMFGFDPEEVADFSLVDTVKDNAKLIKDIIINAFQNAVTYLNFLPDELGLMLKEKYIKLKFMFIEKLQSFMNVFSGIIPGLKVEAMNVIRNMPFGKQIIGDAAYAAALQEKNAALGGNSSAITAIRADRDTQLEALAIERIRLEAARQQLRADGGVGGTSVNNSQTTNSVTILNQSQPVPDDPIALRYAGPNVPVI